jgi:predicted chitinase
MAVGTRFATWAIESGMHLLRLAEVMGTSARQIEETYSRWITTTDEELRAHSKPTTPAVNRGA